VLKGLKVPKHSTQVARVVGDSGYACASWAERPTGGEDCQHLTATKRAVELVEIAAAAAADKLASDIIAYDVSEQLRRVGARPARREGEREARWVLLDYLDIVVHVQHAEERVYYSLERLWKDCPVIPVPEPVGAGGRNGSRPADRG
jgi:ribosome-associated protein